VGKRLVEGDVLEVTAPRGVIYLQFLGKHVHYGPAVAVSPKVWSTRQPLTAQLFSDAYVTFYPATVALKEGWATVVGRLPSPGLPKRYRRVGALEGRRILSWVIEDADKERVTFHLSEEEQHLPIVAIWMHPFLLNRVAEGWRPEREIDSTAHSATEHSTSLGGDDENTEGAALGVLAQSPHAGEPQVLAHYLYFPEEPAANRAATILDSLGFETVVRLSADEEHWVLLARHRVVPTEDSLASARELLEKAAESEGGEYDGWEAETSER
jgi:hypothetical protein